MIFFSCRGVFLSSIISYVFLDASLPFNWHDIVQMFFLPALKVGAYSHELLKMRDWLKHSKSFCWFGYVPFSFFRFSKECNDGMILQLHAVYCNRKLIIVLSGICVIANIDTLVMAVKFCPDCEAEWYHLLHLIHPIHSYGNFYSPFNRMWLYTCLRRF